MTAFWYWLKKITPLRIALFIAVGFIWAHIIIEADTYEFGLLSKKGPIHLLDLKVLDYKFQLLDRMHQALPQPQVVIAAIDERGVERFGLWPWNRKVIAEFIETVTGGGAKVIAFDAVFSDADKNSASANIQQIVEAFEQKKFVDDVDRLVPSPNVLELRQKLLQYQQGLHAMQGQSPDDALALAIEKSPQTILGYFNFYNASDIVGLTKADITEDFKAIEKSAISTVYDVVERGSNSELKPASLKINDLEIRSIIAPQAPLKKFSDKATAFGFFNVPPDGDGVLRRVRLLNLYQDKLYPALSLLSAARYFDAPIQPLNGLIKPGKTLEGIAALNPYMKESIPVDMHGRLLVNYYKRPEHYFKTYSVADIIEGKVTADKYRDKVVLFGLTAIGLDTDLVATPFGPATPGVYVHANVIQNVIDGKYLQRFFGIALLEACGYLLLALFIGFVIPRLPVVLGLVVILSVAISFYLIDLYFIFPRGIWILNMLPTMQAVLSFVGISVHGYLTEGREKRKIRKAFQFYLSKNVVDEVLRDTSKLQLGGERRICSVLFSDIRGFTTISEKLSPEELSHLLNAYLTPMTNLVFKYEGTLDKYMGDAIMAIFGAPIGFADHASRACYSALDMLEELQRLQTHWRNSGLPEIDIGIGINTGPMSVGNMGSDIRFDYTVMGDHVNLGSRLEGINKHYGTRIIISEFTYEAAKNSIYARELDAVRVKGKKEPIRIYELLGKGSAPPLQQTLIHTFSNALLLYKQQQWDAAIALFQKICTDIQVNDPPSKLYLERCEQMRREPPPGHWDGVFTMTTK